MQLHSLSKTTQTSKKRLGRGGGSGKGFHTSSRGQKGQKSRSSVALWFEGGQLPLSKRLPFLRGKDRFKSVKTIITPINLDQIEQNFADKSEVTLESLVKTGLITDVEATKTTVKILGRGELTKAVTITGLPTSASAEKKITKAGGSVTTSESK